MHLVVATVRYDTFQSVHLPHVPRNDVGDVVDGFRQWVFSELGTVVFDKGGKHGFTGDKQAVSLPFVGINTLVGFLRGFQPFAGSFGVLADHAQFTVKQSDTVGKRNNRACGGVIAADDIGRFAAGDFKTCVTDIILPCLSFGKRDSFGIRFPAVRAVL